MAGQVINHLNSIHARASHACGSAPQGMAERWAKDYVAGNYNRRQDELNSGATGYNNEGGASLIAIDEYWAIIRRTKEGLHLPGTQKVIGGQFKRLLETHREAFFAAAPKIVAATEPLGTEKHAKAAEWVERSKGKFEDAINAAQGK